jgi:hypothetical protein
MKTNSFFSFLQKMMVLVTVICLCACQKEIAKDLATEDNTNFQGNKLEASGKVNTWLESQKQLTTAVISTSIDNIKVNLDFNNLYFEKLSETEKLLVVPLKNSFISAVNKGKNPLSLFLLIINKDGNIRKGNIVQFVPKNGGPVNTLPKNTFYNFYNANHLVCDGSFTFLNINDKILYQMNYTNGVLSAYGEKQKKQNASLSVNTIATTASSCYDWYLVTTYYYSDGTTTVVEKYLYTTCSGGPGELQSTLIDETGGGGGDGSVVDILSAFNSHIKQSISPAFESVGPTNYSTDPISGLFSWTVVKGSFSGWSVDAITSYSYYHDRYFDINSNGFVHTYNLFNYHTLSSSYAGSNIAIETTWTQTAAQDQVLNNNTPNTKGKSTVAGSLHHRMRNPIPGINTFLDVTSNASNVANFTPR